MCDCVCGLFLSLSRGDPDRTLSRRGPAGSRIQCAPLSASGHFTPSGRYFGLHATLCAPLPAHAPRATRSLSPRDPVHKDTPSMRHSCAPTSGVQHDC